MLSVNICEQLIPTRKPPFALLHTHHLFLNKTPNLYRFLRYQRIPSSIYCQLQSIKLNPRTVKDSLDDPEPNQEEEVDLYTVNYYKNACGLPDGEAVDAAKRLMVKIKKLSREEWVANADTVLALFSEHGLSRTQISMVVRRLPLILRARPYKTILPKLEFFESIGFTRGASLAEVISRNPGVFSLSLEGKPKPNYNALKEILDSNHELICATIKKNFSFMKANFTRNIASNLKVLREAGVSKSRIVYLVVNCPRIIRKRESQFREAVIELNEMGFDPSSENYIYGVIAFLRRDKSTWNQSHEKFLELGFSREAILSKFRRHPLSMLVTVEKIEQVMDCLVNNMGWPHSDIVEKPYLFRHSLEKRIIPRCSVALFLHSKGILENLPQACTVLEGSEGCFIKRYVNKFAEVVPEVVQIYKGELTFPMKQDK